MSCLPLTQPLPDKPFPSPEPDKEEKVGYFIINGQWHRVAAGETKIGRDASLCSIVLDDETLSKVHAVVESEGAEDTFLYDAGSTNKTKIGKMILRPNCRYKVSDNDIITMGSLTIKFKVVNHEVQTIRPISPYALKKLNEQEERITYMCKKIPSTKSIIDKTSTSNNENHTTNGIQELFKTPSLSVLSPPVKLPKKHYYVPANGTSPVIDIFSQATQCEFVGDNRSKRNDNSKSIDLNFSNDDIYDLPTQCEYHGDESIVFNATVKAECLKESLTPKFGKVGKGYDQNSGKTSGGEFHRGDEKKIFEAPLCEDDIPTQIFSKGITEPSKVREVDGLSDSRTFQCVKKNEMKHSVSPTSCGNFCEDIFDMPTQPNVSVSSNLKFECKVPKKVSKSLEFVKTDGEITNTLRTSDKSKPLESKDIVSVSPNVDVESQNLMTSLLNDGEDEELYELMRVSSPSISIICNDQLTLPIEKIKTERPDNTIQENFSREISDSETQISLDVSIPEVRTRKATIIKPENETLHCDNVSSQNEVQRNELKFEVNKELAVGLGDISLNVSQKFVDDHSDSGNNNTKSNNSFSCTREVKHHELFEDDGELEDLIPTQIFHGQVKGSKVPEARTDEDDIPTQIFPLGVESERLKRCASSGVVNDVTTPGIVEWGDSGDETESDLEIKMCCGTLVKKEVRDGSPSWKSKRDSTVASVELTSPLRPTSASSDKTVSDLDVTELGGVRSSVENCEDFIATQIFLPHQKLQVSAPNATGGVPEPDCEDFIPTQIFPSDVHVRSVSGSTDKTSSDVEAVTRTGEKPWDCDVVVISSEDEFFDVEDNTNESESLIKDVQEFSCLRGDNLEEKKLEDLTLNLNGSPNIGEDEHELSPTLLPSHPVFDSFLEIDVLINNHKKAQELGGQVDSNIKKCAKEGGRSEVSSDSDVTDCEEELEVMRNVRFGKSEETKPEILKDDEEIIRREPSPVLMSTSGLILPPTSTRRGAGVSHERQSGRSKRGENQSSRKGPKKGPNTITQFFPPSELDGAVATETSPMKRTRAKSSGETVPKKKSKSAESRRCLSSELDNGDIVLTQSLQLRNRIVRVNKGPDEAKPARRRTNTEMKTSGKEESDLPIREGEEVGMSNRRKRVTRQSSAKRREPRDKSSSPLLRKDVEQVQVAKKEQRKRRSRGDDVTEEDTWRVGFREEVVPSSTKVVFTGFESESHNRIIAELGGERVNEVGESCILVTDRVRRTVKFLSAVALGIPIVSPKWLVSSAKDREFLNPWDFILEDRSSEERWKFDLKVSLSKWRKQKLLSGYSVHATESTRPPVPELLSIVRCCGGIPITSQPGAWPDKSIVLTCVEDRQFWPPSKSRHVKIVHYEFLLSGVLRHSLDFKTYKLR